MTSTGFVQDITVHLLGSELTAAVAVAGVTLLVDDASDFDEAATRLLRVGGDDPNAELVRVSVITTPDDDDDLDELDYLDEGSAGISAGYGGAAEWDTDSTDLGPIINPDTDADLDGNLDFGPSTVTLDPTTPLRFAWPSGTRVDVWDAGRGAPAVEWRALVRTDSEVNNDDAVDALVAYSLVPLLPEGVRDDDTAELVTLDDSTGEWVVTNVAGRQPEIQGQHLAPGTIQLPALGFTVGQTTVTIASAPPANPHVGDIWYDQTNGYLMNRWDGVAWVASKLGTGAIAFNARDLGGVKVSFGAAPSSGNLSGDLWYDTANGYRLNQWTGSAWTPTQFGTNAIAAGTVTAALIAAGTITAAQLAAGTITGDKIAASTITGDLVAANAIAAGHIAVGALDAQVINAGALNAGSVSAGSIGGSAIDGCAITNTDFVLATTDTGSILVYILTGQSSQTFTANGSWTCPAGITSVRAEVWGDGGGGAGGDAFFGGRVGGGGGEYARETSVGVSPGSSYPVQVGPGGALGTAGSDGSLGIGSKFTGDALAVVAVGGWGGTTVAVHAPAPGGNVSDNESHYAGGTGSTYPPTQSNYAGGGGGGAGVAGAGNYGHRATGSQSGAGGAAPLGATGGAGAGGAGGLPGASGGAGVAPGGGGGGGGGGSSGARAGGAGARGQVKLTWGGTLSLVATIAGSSGTVPPDIDSAQPPYYAGIKTYRPDLIGMIGGYFRHATFTKSVPTATSTNITSLASVKELNDSGVTPFNAGIFYAPLDGVYSFMFQIDALGNGTNRAEMQIGLTRGGNRTNIAENSRTGMIVSACSTAAINWWCLAGDQIDFTIFQNTGGPVSYTGAITVKKEA